MTDYCADGHDWAENLFGVGIVCEVCGVKNKKGIICKAQEIPFDENNNCVSCGHHEDDPDWYCPKCGEFIPNLPDVSEQTTTS